MSTFIVFETSKSIPYNIFQSGISSMTTSLISGTTAKHYDAYFLKRVNVAISY